MSTYTMQFYNFIKLLKIFKKYKVMYSFSLTIDKNILNILYRYANTN